MLEHFLPSLPLDKRSKLVVLHVDPVIQITKPELKLARAVLCTYNSITILQRQQAIR